MNMSIIVYLRNLVPTKSNDFTVSFNDIDFGIQFKAPSCNRIWNFIWLIKTSVCGNTQSACDHGTLIMMIVLLLFVKHKEEF